MAKDVDLLSYWMPVLKQLKEFKEIAKAEDPELRAILEACDRALSNFFIPTADEYGISRLERMVGIAPDEGADLETRRLNLMIKWDDTAVYTDEELYYRLLSFCGEGNFSITPRYDEYAIDISTEIGIRGGLDVLSSFILDVLPCNLVLTLENILKSHSTGALSAGVSLSTAMRYQITTDIDATPNYTSVLGEAVLGEMVLNTGNM